MDANTLKPAAPKRRRRWFQFRLRTLFIAVTVAAVACAYCAREDRIGQEEDCVKVWMKQRGVEFFYDTGVMVVHRPPDDPVPFVRRCFGDEPINFIMVYARITDG